MPFSFESVDALDYDDLRPAYSIEAVRWVAERARLGPNALVVDLAAGTGHLAEAFVALGVRVAAVEPAANMRAVMTSKLPSVRILDGTAEAIPLADGEASAVVVGNAFHHFDPGAAFGELRRVLHEGGALALFWARLAEDEHALDEVWREVDRTTARHDRASAITRAYRSWNMPLERVDGFTPFDRRSFGVRHVFPAARLDDLLATSSDVASLPEAERSTLLDRVRALATGLPARVELAAESDVQLCFRS